MKEEKWVTVYKFYDVLLGQQLEKILKENNIPVSIISRQDSAYDGIFKSSIGEGILQVKDDYVKEAEQIIAEFEKEYKWPRVKIVKGGVCGEKNSSGSDCHRKYRYRNLVFYAVGQSERFSSWSFEAID